MWAIARFDLGLAEGEFWRLTPRQYYALVQRFEERREWENWLAGLVCSTLVNVFRSRAKGRRMTPQDFMARKQPRKVSWQVQLRQVELLNAVFGGADRRHEKCS